jgi:hypothetical protein
MLRAAFLLLAIVSARSVASAQTTAGASSRDPADAAQPPKWSFGASADTYFLPHEDNYVLPIVTADRDALHLEGRYNYEDRNTGSGFVGWTFEAGDRVKVDLTPMFGGVFGATNGVAPALEFALSWGRLEVDSEGEYVIPFDDEDSSYFYNTSEVSVRATDWLRGGVTTQRTRTFHSPRDVQRGFLAGVTLGKVEGVFSWFNPGSSHNYLVVSIRAAF